MLRTIASVLCVIGALALVGCGSGSDNSVPSDTPVTITLTRALDVQEVVILHRVSNSNWVSIFDQQYQNQDQININLDLITGDQYEVDATTFNPTDGTTVVTKQNFTAGTGSSSTYSYNEPYYQSRSAHPAVQHLFFNVPDMARK